MTNKRKGNNSNEATSADRKTKKQTTEEEQKPPAIAPPDSSMKRANDAAAAEADNMFDRANVKESDIDAAVVSLNADSSYTLHLSACPVIPLQDAGPTQTSAVVAIRFQKMSTGVDCWCVNRRT